MFEWDANRLNAGKFAFRGNFVSKLYGDDLDQLLTKDPLTRSITIKATIKKYGGYEEIGIGLLTESRRN
jgi:hypothetical protein